MAYVVTEFTKRYIKGDFEEPKDIGTEIVDEKHWE